MAAFAVRLTLLSLLVLFALPAPGEAGGYRIVKIAGSQDPPFSPYGGPGSQALQAVDLNAAGDVLFTARCATGGLGLWIGDVAGVTEIFQTCTAGPTFFSPPGDHAAAFGHATLNVDRTITLTGLGGSLCSDPSFIYLVPGALPAAEIYESHLSYCEHLHLDAEINDEGAVVFWTSPTPTNTEESTIFVRPAGGVATPLLQVVGGKAVSMNNNGRVVYYQGLGILGDITGIFTTADGTSITTIADLGPTSPFERIGPLGPHRRAINDSGTVAFTGRLVGGSTIGVYVGSGAGITPVSESPTGPFVSVDHESPTINNRGTVAFTSGQHIFAGLPGAVRRVAGFGDPLEGSTITEIRGMALNGANQVAFAAALANGHHGVFLAVPAPDLRVTALGDPPAMAAAGDAFAFDETTANDGAAPAPRTRTRFVLSADGTPDPSDVLLQAAHAVPALGPGAASSRSIRAKVPATMRPGDYRLLACADHRGEVVEGDEGNNCTASAATMHVPGPDLVQVSVGDPPPSLPADRRFNVLDTVRNDGDGPARRSVTRYLLSVTGSRADALVLAGSRSVPELAPAGQSPGTAAVRVPGEAPAGVYFLLACADDADKLPEASEANNCQVSAGTMTIP